MLQSTGNQSQRDIDKTPVDIPETATTTTEPDNTGLEAGPEPGSAFATGVLSMSLDRRNRYEGDIVLRMG